MSSLGEFDDLAIQSNDLVDQEQAVIGRLADAGLDLPALALASNVFRAATAMRRRLEREALRGTNLSWTAFKVLWVLWIWGPRETRFVAIEADVTKGTLTGVLDTLQNRGLVTRTRHAEDRRLMSVGLSAEGREVIEAIFPRFNAEERAIADLLHPADQHALTRGLRRLLNSLQKEDG